MTMRWAVSSCLGLAMLVASCRQPTARPGGGDALFVEVGRTSGLDFHHFNGMSGELYIAEIMAPGCALFDYDDDGDLDAFIVQGHMLDPGKAPDQATVPPPRRALPLTDRLFRNDIDPARVGRRQLRFTDVTEASGIVGEGYAMGAATGDIDNDGDMDLYVTHLGPNQLWRNNGDGTFTEVAETAGADDPRWSTSASFLDYDRDGWLDLYVANYVHFTVAINRRCTNLGGALDYCAPLAYDPGPDRLLRNRGDGTFEDVSVRAGIADRVANGLGVVAADFDSDGWMDLYVANDLMHNILWRNRGDGTFEDTALVAGCATDASGVAQSSMGVDAGDVDNDGDEDVFVGHMIRQTSTLYLNSGHAVFSDATARSGIGALSAPITTYGVALTDVDNDGWLDVVAANGAMVNLDAQLLAGEPYPLREPNQLYRNRGDATFEDLTPRAPPLQVAEVSRGAAVGDVDNDGDPDLLIANSNGPTRLYLNRAGGDAHWLGLRLVGRDVSRDMLGARVTVVRADGSSLLRRVRTDGSYCSASDPRVLFGLAARDDPVRVIVRWPAGPEESWDGLEVDRYHTLREGSGS